MHSSTVRESRYETRLGPEAYIKLKLFIKVNMYFIRYNLPKSIIINRLLFKIYRGQLLHNFTALGSKIYSNSIR